MTRGSAEVDWAELARLPSITAEGGDLDIVELVQRHLVVPRLRLTSRALESVEGVESLVVRDVEATPLLHGWVRGAPSAADLVRLDALVAPHSRVTWLALAGRTRAGRQQLADLPAVMAARPQGEHVLIRVPWPAPGSRGLFER